jgi:hypothetical protein
MDIKINGLQFEEMPWSCGSCPALNSGGFDKAGFCMFFKKQKRKYENVPKRCKTLFEKGFKMGGELVIIIKD